MRITALPTKTYAPLIVDSDAPLPFPLARQLLQPVTGWGAQVIDSLRSVDYLQLAASNVLYMRCERADMVAFEQRRGHLVIE